MWLNICASCHKSISSQIWKKFEWKMKSRFFRAPIRCDCRFTVEIGHFLFCLVIYLSICIYLLLFFPSINILSKCYVYIVMFIKNVIKIQ